MLSLLLTLALAAPQSEGPHRPFTIGVERSLHSSLLSEERKLWIHTPEGYAQGSQHYPVLYLLDGGQHFHHTTGTTSFLARNGRAPQMIVVGVQNTDRTRDLTPSRPEDVDEPMATAGGAEAFLGFLVEELTPWLDENYRTRRPRVLIGHSFGGLFALHTLQSRPEFFQGFIAISPSMQWDEQELVADLEEWLASGPGVTASIYMTVGNEGTGLLGGTLKVSGLLSEMAPPGLRWKFVHMPRETHGSVPHRSTYDGLEFLFEGWSLVEPLPLYDAGGLPAVRGHLVGARQRLDCGIEVEDEAFFPLIIELLSARRLTDARAVAVELGEGVPASLWNYLARTLEDHGDGQGSLACYQECLRHHPWDTTARKALVDAELEPPPLPEEAFVPPELLEAYAGSYRMTKYGIPVLISLVEGKLHAAVDGREARPLHARSRSEFIGGGGGLFRFHLDREGVGQLVIQRGETLACEREEE